MNDWEISRLTELNNHLETFQGLQECEDYLWWTGHTKKQYKVNSGDKTYEYHRATDLYLSLELIWKIKLPHKVACSTWLLAKESVLTHENLMKRGLSLASNCCLMWD